MPVLVLWVHLHITGTVTILKVFIMCLPFSHCDEALNAVGKFCIGHFSHDSETDFLCFSLSVLRAILLLVLDASVAGLHLSVSYHLLLLPVTPHGHGLV